MAPRGILFSDVDGTLVHYPEVMDKLGTVLGRSADGKGHTMKTADGTEHTVIKLHPSSTGMQGTVSLKALQQLKVARNMGFKIVVISGARTSTMMQRLPFLPLSDAVVTENGGRIFMHNTEMLNAAPYFEDMSWRDTQTAAGPSDQDTVPPEDRKGPLWDIYRLLQKDGWQCDTNSYVTSFRIKIKQPKTKEQLDEIMKQMPPSLTYSYNLGMADIYPATSGKDKAAQFLMNLWGVPAKDCSLLCDDDNDLGIAAVVNKVYLPSISAETIKAAAAAQPDKFFVAKSDGTLGTDEAVEAFINKESAGLLVAP
mmetsp:Transcript_32699/g.92759  ORF Transcript_32699/g.92759 Transcript_32699/m.92759 type:complete len:311 (-) Transcript_32699:136-1068(-)|eukprot:CAMPEP_0117666424 /NCGR_PEP_ID=MMETSP0804-20121206/10369_1 /TAXON_ID=1074897 /ORGANISM="Tetraselmis astigmatica, Strain CCMP880" /LENGTH=310 /DNA_ID=CAMNT_0005473969 /DNA_START=166 /DNA_END=1098 /DNA_ORIENTATION=+